MGPMVASLCLRVVLLVMGMAVLWSIPAFPETLDPGVRHVSLVLLTVLRLGTWLYDTFYYDRRCA